MPLTIRIFRTRILFAAFDRDIAEATAKRTLLLRRSPQPRANLRMLLNRPRWSLSMPQTWRSGARVSVTTYRATYR